MKSSKLQALNLLKNLLEIVTEFANQNHERPENSLSLAINIGCISIGILKLKSFLGFI